jgi:hypothetical protein
MSILKLAIEQSLVETLRNEMFPTANPYQLMFASRKKLKGHFGKHTIPGVLSPDEYQQRANAIINSFAFNSVPAKRNAIRTINPYTKENVIWQPDEQKLLTYYIRKAYLEGAI